MVIEGNGFAIKRARQPKNLEIIRSICRELFGADSRVEISGEDNSAEVEKKKDASEQKRQAILGHPLVADAVEIFQGEIIDIKEL